MTKMRVLAFAVLLLFALGISDLAAAQHDRTRSPVEAPVQAEPETQAEAAQPAIVRREGMVIVPASSVVRPEDAGLRAHTNYELFVPKDLNGASVSPDTTYAEYPQSLACVYKVGTAYAGCTPNNGTNVASGGWGAIALVDAYDDPTAASDLAFFSSYMHLPAPNFRTVIANSSFGTLNGMTASCSGTPANANVPGWDVEESLDIEYAHAMAPSAEIILVEACTASLGDLLYAEQVAGIEVAKAGGGDISNSWGGGEFAGEVGTVDDVFYRYHYSRISYFASAGDSGWGAQYPSSSPWVVSAGGTTINRDAAGNFVSESCWGDGINAPSGHGSGGGVSAYEKWQSPPNILNGMGPWANFQYEMAGATARQTPDMSFDADPASGAWVYDTDSGGAWGIVGGTSLASPALAGIVNSANNRMGQTPSGGGLYQNHENELIYSQLYAISAYPHNFYDVKTGSNGAGHSAGTGYDQCTGVGSPRGKLGK